MGGRLYIHSMLDLTVNIFSEVEEELREKEADQTLTERDHRELQRLRDFLNSDQ